MNKQQLAAKIWESANKMRSKIEANEYKDYILGLIFYKFLSDKEVAFLKNNDWLDEDFVELVEEDIETVEQCKKNIGYFISYKNLFSTWVGMKKEFDASNVTDALSAFDRMIDESYKRVFDKIFNTLQTGIAKLGDTNNARTKAISGLINLIKDIPMDEKQGYDVLGFIYEYLISNFAANAGKKAGEFYTPHEVSVLISEIVAQHLKDRESIAIYDPTSGSGSLLINIGKSASKYMQKDKIEYYAQELKDGTYNLTRMNLVMRGISPSNIFTRNADTLEDDWPIDVNSYPPVLRVDAVVSNPPYSQTWLPDDKELDPRYSEYGIAPKSKADYAFLLHDLYHVNSDGIMCIVLPHGVLFRGGSEETIRKNLIEKNNIDTIIGLPPNIFYGTGIPTIIMVLKQNRTNKDILIIDASKGFEKEGKNNKLRASDIKKIVDVIVERKTIPKFSRVVGRNEIRKNDYNLNIPRYVDSSEDEESYDIYASMVGEIPNSEIDMLSKYWDAFPSLKGQLFSDNGTPYSIIKVDNIRNVVFENRDVMQFIEEYTDLFDSLESFLEERLIDNMENVEPVGEEDIIGKDIFKRLENISLVDCYEAYQRLDDCWVDIAIDFDIIKSEGKNAIRMTEPNYVIKKGEEVQDGWKGKILPYELVQENLLYEDLRLIGEKERQIDDFERLYQELIEQLSDDDKESGLLNDSRDSFENKAVNVRLKELKKVTTEEEQRLKCILEKYVELHKDESALISEVKVLKSELLVKTKETIENLSDEQMNELVKLKWIIPLLKQLNDLPYQALTDFIKRVQMMSDKYAVSLTGIEQDIVEAEDNLVKMLDGLCGNEFDMKGIAQFEALLGGKQNG